MPGCMFFNEKVDTISRGMNVDMRCFPKPKITISGFNSNENKSTCSLVSFASQRRHVKTAASVKMSDMWGCFLGSTCDIIAQFVITVYSKY